MVRMPVLATEPSCATIRTMSARSGSRRPNLLQRSLPAAALACAALLALWLAWTLNIWQDEAYTLNTTGHGIAYAFHQALTFEQNAPLYFVMLALWRNVNGDPFFLRLFSVLCAAGAIALVPGLARRYVPQIDPWIVAVISAWNPFLIWAAAEMRTYALLILISALLARTFFDGFVDEAPSPRARLGYVVVAIAGMYAQYYVAFLIAAHLAAVVLFRRRNSPAFVAAGAAIAAAFAPLAWIVAFQVQNFRTGFAPPSLARSLLGVADILAHYVFPLPIPHVSLVYAAIALAAVAAAFVFRRSLARAPSVTTIAIASATFAAVFFGVGTYLGGVHVLIRHPAALYIPTQLALFALLTLVPAAVRRPAIATTVSLLLAASSISLFTTYRTLSKPGDWKRVDAYIETHERRGEPIAVFQAESALPFAWYYRGPNAIVVIPRAVNFTRYDVTQFIVRSETQLRATMPRANRVWLITAGECISANVSFGCDVVERFVARHYGVLTDFQFHGARVRLLGSNREYFRK